MFTTALPLEALAKWGRFKLLATSYWQIAKVFFVVLILATLYLILSTNSAFAEGNSQETVVGELETVNYQTTSYGPNFESDVPRDQHSAVQSVLIEVMSAMVCQLSGVDPIRADRRCLGANPQTGKIGFVDGGGGALGLMATAISYTFTPPASSGQYINYMASSFGLTKTAYAQTTSTCAQVGNSPQGIGFCGILPLIPAWRAMRNITYLLLVIIFAIIGVAIMLRVRIDPRTVMTIQNQIPKIIVAIVMITFSFAIAGFLIDVMYVSIYLVGQVIVSIQPSAIQNFGEVATSGTTFDAINRLWPGNPNDITQPGGFVQLSGAGSDTIKALIENVLDINFSPPLESIFDIIPFLAGVILGLFVFLVILIALIYIAVRLFIILLVAYISILLDVVFGPFWFLIGLVPGSSMGVGAWFRDIIANLAVFPTALAMFLLAKIFFEIISAPGVGVGVSGALFTPPLVGGTGGGGDGASIFAGLVALGFLFMTPQVLTITKAALKAPKISYGPVLAPAAVGVGVAGGIPKRAAVGGFNYAIAPSMAERRGAPGAEPGRLKKVARMFTGTKY